MALARIDEVADAVVAKIAALWQPQLPDAVEAVDEINIVTNPKADDCIQGRQVYVLPDTYDSPESSARGSDWNDYTVLILIARRYTTTDEAATNRRDWIRAERLWVEQVIYQPLTDVRAVRLLSDSDSGGLYPIAPSGVETPFDLVEWRDKNLFLSVVRVTYREDVEA